MAGPRTRMRAQRRLSDSIRSAGTCRSHPSRPGGVRPRRISGLSALSSSTLISAARATCRRGTPPGTWKVSVSSGGSRVSSPYPNVSGFRITTEHAMIFAT